MQITIVLLNANCWLCLILFRLFLNCSDYQCSLFGSDLNNFLPPISGKSIGAPHPGFAWLQLQHASYSKKDSGFWFSLCSKCSFRRKMLGQDNSGDSRGERVYKIRACARNNRCQYWRKYILKCRVGASVL